MPTLILTPRQTEDSRQLWRAAIELGWGVERLPDWRVSERMKQVEEPVLYVESLMTPLIAAAFKVRLSEPPEDWLASLPEEYRRRTVRRMTLGEARRLPKPAFIKPPNDKSFPARVYEPSELPLDFSDEISVLVAEPVCWEIEFRCFILDRKLRTFSVYLREGALQRDFNFVSSDAEDEAMRGFLQRVLSDHRVQLPRAIVMDVGTIAGRGWAVVEVNAAWGSGIYGCDPREVLQVLRHTVERLPAAAL